LDQVKTLDAPLPQLEGGSRTGQCRTRDADAARARGCAALRAGPDGDRGVWSSTGVVMPARSRAASASCWSMLGRSAGRARPMNRRGGRLRQAPSGRSAVRSACALRVSDREHAAVARGAAWGLAPSRVDAGLPRQREVSTTRDVGVRRLRRRRAELPREARPAARRRRRSVARCQST